MTQYTHVKKKLKIGWFSFTCSEDSTILWIELMNDNYFKWKNLIDIRHARVLKKNNDLSNLDVAFVEGANYRVRCEEAERDKG